MRYEPIPNELFKLNRKKFVERMLPNSIAIFHSNDILPTNADGVLPFKQNSDLFYLSGIDQEETALVLFPDSTTEMYKEMLFLRETNELIAIWEGHKFTKEEGKLLSGLGTIFWQKDLDEVLQLLIPQAEYIYINNNEHARSTSEVETRNDRLGKALIQKYSLMKYERSAPIMHQLRFIKSEAEIDTIKTACDITDKAFRRVLSFTKPGKFEFEIEAEATHEFLINRSRGHAYQPIIASGKNACVLHYIENNEEVKDGDLILMDFGAEYGNYNADMTRTIPANGKFSERQKSVYNAVLHVMNEAKKMLVPGNTFPQYNEAVGKIMEKELIKLGLLDADKVAQQDPKSPLYRKYFMHGTSHSLGLDVHDVDDRRMPFEKGMVFTCEPGIYIPEENIGVRIENNIVVDDEPRDLMGHIPITVEEIEELMSK